MSLQLEAQALRVFRTHRPTLPPSLPHKHTRSFDVYDAVATAPANYFLLKRSTAPLNSTTTTTTAAANDTTATTSAVAANDAAAAALAAVTAGKLLPGDAGRWALPADVSGLQELSYMYEQVDVMYDTWVLYGVLQGVVLVLLLLRLVHHLSFQPR